MSENDPSPVEIPPRGQFLSNGLYDTLKWIAQIFLPALGALYFTLSGIWDLPAAEQVVGTVTAVDLFLGLLLGLSARQYNDQPQKFDGVITVDTVNPDKDVFQFDLGSMHPLELVNKDSVTFKVANVKGEVPKFPGNDS